jgi:hypothetical protein
LSSTCVSIDGIIHRRQRWSYVNISNESMTCRWLYSTSMNKQLFVFTCRHSWNNKLNFNVWSCVKTIEVNERGRKQRRLSSIDMHTRHSSAFFSSSSFFLWAAVIVVVASCFWLTSNNSSIEDCANDTYVFFFPRS